jgi:hypothetical protein
MSKKYYRVLKENFLWHVGAILEATESANGYTPLDGNSIWDVTDHNGGEYISKRIVENFPEYFERVYAVNLLKSMVFKVKEEARQMLQDGFK